jgi:nucleotide-binding universal stress UspA family protein
MHSASSEPILLCPHSLIDRSDRTGASRRADEAGGEEASFREILACVDDSEFGSRVVPHAGRMAEALGGRVTLLHVLESESTGSGSPPDPLEWGIRKREARQRLARASAGLDGLESGVRAELIQGRPAEQICSWAEQHDVDLTVLCSHGRHGVTEWGLASTARKLIDGIRGSFLLVPPTEPVRGTQGYQRILVPLDGSPRAESVIPIALRIAAFEGAELVFVYVVPTPEITTAGFLDAEGAELERRVAEHNERVASSYLDRIRARSRQAGARARVVVITSGSVQSRLASMMRDEAVDLVVMSAHGHSGRKDSPCGAVTQYALTHTSAPLLVVRDGPPRRARRISSPDARLREWDESPGPATV